MPKFPTELTDPFDAAQAYLDKSGSGFQAPIVAGTSGTGTRQSRLPNERPGVSTRNLMQWFVPERPIVQMYINPQELRIDNNKTIQSQRTKGGFVLQYWGEELIKLSLSGTTGTSGIEGINVLYDVYRNEQLAIDPYALFLAAQQDSHSISGPLADFGSFVGGKLGNEAAGGLLGSVLGGVLQGAENAANPSSSQPRPSLAEFAFQVELYWSGEVYRGFFTSFGVTESVTSLGMFNYQIGFTATQKRGFRQNFLGWHRSATSGPSNSNPEFGTPHSFASLVSPQPTPQKDTIVKPDILNTLTNKFGI